MRRTICSAALMYLTLSVTSSPSTADQQRFEFATAVMGTRGKATFYADRPQVANDAWLAVTNRWQQLEAMLSDYRRDSESEKLAARSDAANAEWLPVSDELFRLLRISKDFSDRSHGAFDVTVGPLTRLWRQARRRGGVPSAKKIQMARRSVGYQFVELDQATNRIRFNRLSMRLDFGAVGKGYAADAALHILHEFDIQRAVVDLGGDLALGDVPPGRTGWSVSVQNSVGSGKNHRTPECVLRLSRCGVATSGDVARGLKLDRQRLSHILDPRSGEPLVNSWTVTIIARDSMTADACASVLSVMGPQEGLPWLAKEFPEAAGQFRRKTEHGEASVANEPFIRLASPTKSR